ncbi:MAG: hypothetical protein JWM53_5735 [bacterium]|nr:hypothetical protein [bacterium]
MSIEEWPARSVARQVDRPDRSEKDSAVARLAEQRVETFVEKNVEETAADVVAQIRILKRLLFEARFGENDRYVSTNELQDFLATTFGGQYPTEWMRASVIAPLRDSGVLIASSPRGYKIPTSIADLQSFVAHADRVITPMAQRLRIARDAVRMLTHGEVDILGGESYVVLARAVDALASLRRDSP